MPQYQRHSAQREAVRAGILAAKSRLTVAGSLYRALRLPVIAKPAAAVMREADLRGMLDGVLLVVGTNALAAYELESGARFAAGLDTTEDFDLLRLTHFSENKKRAAARSCGVTRRGYEA